jgi:hypothetical protein
MKNIYFELIKYFFFNFKNEKICTQYKIFIIIKFIISLNYIYF